MTDKNKPNFILTFSKEKLTKEQDDELLSEFFYTLYKWYISDKEEKTNQKIS